MLETAERLVDRGEAAVGPAVPAARRRAAGDGRRASTRPARCSTPTCCARWPWPATRRRSTHCARCGDRRAAPVVQPSRPAGALCADCRVPGSASPAAGDARGCWARCWPATGRSSDAADPRHLREGQRPGRGVPALAPRARAAVPGVRRAQAGAAAAVRAPLRPGTPRAPARALAADPHPSGARPPDVPTRLVPRHVAIIMDGNGRWAKARGLPRTAGPRAGRGARSSTWSRAPSRSA